MHTNQSDVDNSSTEVLLSEDGLQIALTTDANNTNVN